MRKGILTDRFFYYLMDFDNLVDTVDDWNKINYYKECIGELENRINKKFKEFKERSTEEETENVTLSKEMELILGLWSNHEQPLRSYYEKRNYRHKIQA